VIRDRFDQLHRDGRIEVRLDLDPPELGRLHLHVAMHDDKVSIRMIVQDEGARRMVDEHLEPLRVRFAEMGVSLGQLDVRRDGDAPKDQAEADTELDAARKTRINRAQTTYTPSADSAALVDLVV
ncbi:MAG: flagellar hook-length control protein FliK, partial [Planctomycetes bacterium]|nr:flagellar hook-length control protein FliK [Planctomycetota bacterium]